MNAVRLGHRVTVAEIMRVRLIGCVKEKAPDPSLAKDLHLSTLFRGRRTSAKQLQGLGERKDRWFAPACRERPLCDGHVHGTCSRCRCSDIRCLVVSLLTLDLWHAAHMVRSIAFWDTSWPVRRDWERPTMRGLAVTFLQVDPIRCPSQGGRDCREWHRPRAKGHHILWPFLQDVVDGEIDHAY